MENNNAKKFCPVCGAEIEQDYLYCPVCGKATGFETVNTASNENGASGHADANNGYTQGFNPNAGVPDSIDGVPLAEIGDYIGANSNKFIPKFFKYSCGAKAGWNWPTFLFGYFFSTPFVWFFYRKMYKVGVIVLAVTLALNIATLACIGVMFNALEEPLSDYLEDTYDLYDKYSNDYGLTYDEIDDNIAFQRELNELAEDFANDIIESNTVVPMVLFMMLISLLMTVFLIIVSIFANYWYYKKTIGDLKRLNANGFPNAYVVQSVGGTKAWVPIVIGIGLYVFTVIGVLIAMMPFYNTLLI